MGQPYIEAKASSILSQIVRNFILGWVMVVRGRKAHPWQAAVLRGGEEFQTVVPLTPREADSGGRVEYDGLLSAASKALRHGEAGLPTSDDDRVHALWRPS